MTLVPASSGGQEGSDEYELRISPATVDKLGVKLYDKVSAAVAELIANSYDADATGVTVDVPIGVTLALRDENGQVKDRGYVIEVRDDGHGMTPTEAKRYFLDVGRDRRTDPGQGPKSPKGRKVMGRKGIGKLAPFGICKRIEVLSSGGERTAEGYLTSHFILEYGRIMTSATDRVPLEKGAEDGSYRDSVGTTIRLSDFHLKRVPNKVTFERQIARRFALADAGFQIVVIDTTLEVGDQDHEFVIPEFAVDTLAGTRIDISNRPVTQAEGEPLAVTGWLGLAQHTYENEEMAGVRIYSRGKIVATTRDFEQPAGYTGEYTVRSYLVGEVHAEWLDADDGEDLVRTDRQGILWDSDLGQALRDWGTALLREIGAASRTPRRERVSDQFMKQVDLESRAHERYGDEEVVEAALRLGKQIGSFAAEDELTDEEYVSGLAEFILAIAPHQALMEAFRAIALATDPSISDMTGLLGKTRVAELASYSQLASNRVLSIKELEAVIRTESTTERDLQELIARAPWLIQPDWSVLTENQSLNTFRRQFEAFYKRKFSIEIEVAISYERKRPDFTLIAVGRKLHIVELKAPGHEFSDTDYDRLANYLDAFEEFEAKNPSVISSLADGWGIDLIADGVRVTDRDKGRAFRSAVSSRRVQTQTWEEFLARAVVAHEQFINAHEDAYREQR